MDAGYRQRGLVTFGLGMGDDNYDPGKDADELGEKGLRQLFLTRLGLPVPPGFILTGSLCAQIRAHGGILSPDIWLVIKHGIRCIENSTGLVLGDHNTPLFLSVRPSPRHGLPYSEKSLSGIGFNGATARGLENCAENKSHVWEVYCRFLQAYAHRISGIPFSRLEHLFSDTRDGHENTVSRRQSCLQQARNDVLAQTGCDFPEIPEQQLNHAINVFLNDGVRRDQHHKGNVPFSNSLDRKVALIVQAMVFGTFDDRSAQGCALTHHALTGETGFWGRYVLERQVEDNTLEALPPQFLSDEECKRSGSLVSSLERLMPDVCHILQKVISRVRMHVYDVCSIPFVVQGGRLWILDAKPSLCTPQAVFRVRVDAVQFGSLKRDTALTDLNPIDVDRVFHAAIDSPQTPGCLATGLAASPGAACGRVVFSAEQARAWATRGEDIILVCPETGPGDVYGLHVAKGIVTAHGGITSHAAVVARGMGRPCVAAVHSLIFNDCDQKVVCGESVLSEGQWVTIDGTTGQIFLGKRPITYPTPDENVVTVLKWADSRRRMRVRANCDTQHDAAMACQLGADGIGLCRSEHMFFAPDRLLLMQKLILAEDRGACAKIFEELSTFQRHDLTAIFSTMKGMPVAVRFLDPPLHEFLPRTPDDIEVLAQAESTTTATVQRAINRIKESNPMLGYRGCRVGIVHPDIYTMQAQATFEAALSAAMTTGFSSLVEFIIPFVSTVQELHLTRTCIDKAAQHVFDQKGQLPSYVVGVMIEVPRAALCAGDLARHVDFFSFGTNDLTQMTLGLSRDDAVHFMPTYQEKGIYSSDPFAVLEQDSVGELLELAVQRGRKVRPDLIIGMCGEHGADPETILFCERLGLDYVSCSPYRVPAARLAAAQASLSQPSERMPKVKCQAEAL